MAIIAKLGSLQSIKATGGGPRSIFRFSYIVVELGPNFQMLLSVSKKDAPFPRYNACKFEVYL